MEDTNSGESPLEAVAAVTGTEATEAFSLLGNETRLAILLALWEAYEPFADGTAASAQGSAVPFSVLRDRVGIRDSGQFNYHLGQFEGQFVEQTPDGYRLLPAGNNIVRTVIASAGFEETALEPSELDMACWHCGAPTAVTYQNQRLYHVCTECEGTFELGDKHPSGVLGGVISNPAILSHPTPEAIYTARNTANLHNDSLRVGGVCPDCSGALDTELHICEAHDPEDEAPCSACGRQFESAMRYVCTVCKAAGEKSLIQKVLELRHPAVGAFYWNHDIDLGDNTWDVESERLSRRLMERADQELVSTEPPRVRVTIRYEGDELRLVLDEEMDVIEVSEDG